MQAVEARQLGDEKHEGSSKYLNNHLDFCENLTTRQSTLGTCSGGCCTAGGGAEVTWSLIYFRTMAEFKEGMTLCIRLVRSFEHRNIRVRGCFESDLIVLVLHVWI